MLGALHADRSVAPRGAYGTAMAAAVSLKTTALALATAVALLAGACSGEDGDRAAPGSTAPPGSATDLPPCEPRSEVTQLDAVGSATTGTLVAEAEVVPGPTSALSGEVVVTTVQPAVVTVVGSDGDGRTVTPPPTARATEHAVALVGMRAETAHDVVVTAEAADGTTEAVTLSFTTGSLPADLPPIDVTVSEPEAMAPGVTVFNVRQWLPDPAEVACDPGEITQAGLLVGLDEDGEVVWYYRSTLEVTDVSVTPRGTMWVSVHDVLAREIDVLGRTERELGGRVALEYAPYDFHGAEYASADTVTIDVDSAHHELYELPSGNLLTISTEVVDLDPAAAEGICDGVLDDDDEPVPDPTGVVSDIVVELTPDGEVVREWPMTDYFDPLERPGSDLCVVGNPFAPPNWFYPGRDLRDWTHANAAVLDEASNTLLVSLRHLDAVLGIRYADDADGPAGELRWELGPDGTLELLEGEHSLHGHAIEPQPDGSLLYYDNGNGRPGTNQAGGDEPAYSRAVRVVVDEEAGTATQLWEHRDVTPEGLPVMAMFLSDADRLANGNVLITHGGVGNADGFLYSRLVEVVPAAEGDGGEVVFDVTIGNETAVGYTVYRAERLPSLYGPGADDATLAVDDAGG